MQIQYRSEGKIHAMGAQLVRHDDACALGETTGQCRIVIVQAAKGGDGREQSERRMAKTLHPPAFVIHADEAVRRVLVYVAAQGEKLGAVGIIACKKNDAGDKGMLQVTDFLRVQGGAVQTDEEHGKTGLKAANSNTVQMRFCYPVRYLQEASIMSERVFCVKLKKEGERLSRKPVPGALGERIYREISREAWEMWLAQQTMLINEHRLTSFEPQARAFLQERMEAFLFADQNVAPEQYQPAGKA